MQPYLPSDRDNSSSPNTDPWGYSSNLYSLLICKFSFLENHNAFDHSQQQELHHHLQHVLKKYRYKYWQSKPKLFKLATET